MSKAVKMLKIKVFNYNLLTRIAQEIRNEFGGQVSFVGRDRFNTIFDTDVADDP